MYTTYLETVQHGLYSGTVPGDSGVCYVNRIIFYIDSPIATGDIVFTETSKVFKEVQEPMLV